MTVVLVIILGLGLCVLALIGFAFFISSIREGEKRASILSGLQFMGMALLLILFFTLNSFGFFNSGVGFWIMVFVLIIGALSILMLLLRFGKNQRSLKGTKGWIIGEVQRYDERETVFSRNKEKMEAPDGGMQVGKIDGVNGMLNIAMAVGCHLFPRFLATPDKFSPVIANNKMNINPEEASVRIKGFTKSLGADLVGIAKLNQNWIYSYRGLSDVLLNEWGKKIDIAHKYVIVFAEEMDYSIMGSSPHTPIMIETNRNYAKGAFIGVQVATAIANMGFSATANFFERYDGIMVPMAVDAGLGEASRMGYLISKEIGPRMRLSAVTTDLPLIPDKPVDIGVYDFCRKCKKCAHCCPSRSIPFDDDPKVINGTLRWKVDNDSCFNYWLKVGTDCGICMRVCPWAHNRTLPHKLIVEAVSRNKFSRSLFTAMDDVFYGRKPKQKAPPEWAKY
jgi:reductive dehalogenase